MNTYSSGRLSCNPVLYNLGTILSVARFSGCLFFGGRGATRLYREGGVVGGPDTRQSLALGGAALEALPQKAAALTKTVHHAVIVSVWGITG